MEGCIPSIDLSENSPEVAALRYHNPEVSLADDLQAALNELGLYHGVEYPQKEAASMIDLSQPETGAETDSSPPPPPSQPARKRKRPASKAAIKKPKIKPGVAVVVGRKSISMTDKPPSPETEHTQTPRKENKQRDSSTADKPSKKESSGGCSSNPTRQSLMEIRDMAWRELADNPTSIGLMSMYDRLDRLVAGEKKFCFIPTYRRAKLKLNELLDSDAQRHSHLKARKGVEKAELRLISLIRNCILRLEKNE